MTANQVCEGYYSDEGGFVVWLVRNGLAIIGKYIIYGSWLHFSV